MPAGGHICCNLALDSSTRLLWLKVDVTAGMFAALVLSHRLWLSERFYPLTPVARIFGPVPAPFDWIAFAAMLTLAAWVAVSRRSAAATLAFVTLAVAMALFDQSRWQPWFYQYLFMIAALGWAFRSGRDEDALNICRLIIVCTYFWSGLQKISGTFASDVFPWMAEPVAKHLPAGLQRLAPMAGLASPFVEAAIGLGLLFRKTRPAAIAGAIAMHLFILVGIGPWGHNVNDVVWPWNLVMIAAVLLLFWNSAEAARATIVWGGGWLKAAALALFGIAPALSFFGIWDGYLSSALYAANRNLGTIHVSDDVLDRLPQSAQDAAEDDSDGLNKLDISDFSFAEMNVPPYPEVRIYKNVARKICSYSGAPGDVKLVVKRKITLLGGGDETTFGCADLKQ